MTFLFRLHLLTYLVSLWAFLALVLTGQLHALSIVLFLVFWVAAVLRDKELWRDVATSGWGQIHAAASVKIPNWLWTLVSLTAFALAMYGWFGLEERMYAVTYFFLYLEVNKLFTASTNRDYLQIYALTFFHMLAASVSTDSFVFAPMLVGYLFLILQALTTFTIKRDVEGVLAEQTAREALTLANFTTSAPYRLKDSDANALSRVAYDKLDFKSLGLLIQRNFAVLSVVVMLLGMGVFWIVPRTAKQNFFNPGLRSGALSTRISGYADEISFGGLGQIQNDPTIIMRAQPLPDYLNQRPGFLRIRGTALDFFTGREWSKSSDLITQQQLLNRVQDVSFSNQSVDVRFESIYKAQLTIEPTSTNYFFLLDSPLSVHMQTPVNVQKDAKAMSLRVETERYETISYESNALFLNRDRYLAELNAGRIAGKDQVDITRSERLMRMVEVLAEEILRRDGSGQVSLEEARGRAKRRIEQRVREFTKNELQADEREAVQYTQFPAQIPKDQLIALATEWTQGATTDAEKALQLESYLKNNFNYTLDISFSNREDHLLYFLTQSRAGHCEYFATSMVMLLRSIGISSRIVNGYLTDEWNPGQGRFIVRQEHAHSWVEAQIGPDNRWITFDPTPENGIGSNRIAISWYHRFSSAFDGLRMWWYNNVVDYNENDQQAGFRYLMGLIFQMSENSSENMNRFQSLFNNGTKTASSAAQRVVMIAGVLAVLMSVVLLVWFLLWRNKKEQKEESLFEDRSLREDILPFREFILLLQKHHLRRPGQTPLDYAQSLAKTLSPEFEALVPLTRRYYEARYGELIWNQQEREQLRQLEAAFQKSLKEKTPLA